jgi:hypothetical protein
MAHAWPVNRGPRRLRKALHRELRKAVRTARSVDWKHDPNYRWITVHAPGGTGSDRGDGSGTPVLIRMHPDGTAHVVGGAGGSLSGMRLTKLRSPEELRVEARARASAREAKKEARALEHPAEVEAENEQRAAVQEKVQIAKAEALKEVAQALGWDATVRLPEDVAANMDEKQVARLERKRQRALLSKVKQAVNAVQTEVINEHNEAVARAIGDVPIDEILTPEVDATGKGYVDSIENLARENGLTEGRVKGTQEQVTDSRLAISEALGYIQSADKAKAFIGMMQAGAEDAREADKPFVRAGVTKPEVGDVRQAIREDPEAAKRVLLAYQKLRGVEKEAAALEREAARAEGLDTAKIARGVTMLERAQELKPAEAEAAAEEALSQKAMTDAVSSLLEHVEDFEEDHGSIERHIMGARFAQLSNLYQQATHDVLPIDRRVADLLGIDAAATLAAEVMRERLGDKLGDAQTQLIERHAKTQAALSDAAVEGAREKITAAHDLLEGLPALEEADADALLLIQTKNHERMGMLGDAGRDLGVALGRLEAAGHLNQALRGRAGDMLTLSLGEVGTRDALNAVRALGLNDGEYDIQADGANRFLRIPTEVALEKLVSKTDPAVAKDYADAEAIKKGSADEDGWLPAGIAERPNTSYSDEWAPAFQFQADADFKGKTGEDMDGAVRDYAAAMLANDGVGSVRDLRAQMLSAEFVRDNVGRVGQEDYQTAVNGLFPPEVVDDPQKAVPLTQELVQRHRAAGDAAAEALDSQAIDVSEGTYDVVHRTLAAMPEAKCAFTPLSQLSGEERDTIRDFFWAHITHEEKPKVAQVAKDKAAERARAGEVLAQQANIFGEMEDVKREDTEAYQEH